ncbi:hypothetical protein DRN73_08540 [Candidatus Pacearchaeota archaeon]|nr:MAG: hypothetical protein DRN73_08540 [Candidatus Pacearchaeota archaeon]
MDVLKKLKYLTILVSLISFISCFRHASKKLKIPVITGLSNGMKFMAEKTKIALKKYKIEKDKKIDVYNFKNISGEKTYLGIVLKENFKTYLLDICGKDYTIVELKTGEKLLSYQQRKYYILPQNETDYWKKLYEQFKLNYVISAEYRLKEDTLLIKNLNIYFVPTPNSPPAVKSILPELKIILTKEKFKELKNYDVPLPPELKTWGDTLAKIKGKWNIVEASLIDAYTEEEIEGDLIELYKSFRLKIILKEPAWVYILGYQNFEGDSAYLNVIYPFNEKFNKFEKGIYIIPQNAYFITLPPGGSDLYIKIFATKEKLKIDYQKVKTSSGILLIMKEKHAKKFFNKLKSLKEENFGTFEIKKFLLSE